MSGFAPGHERVTRSPDPVSQASSYQQMLLGLVGEDDAAEVQAATPAQVKALLEQAGPALSTRPAEGEWSVLELLGHLADAELVVGGRYRWALCEDHPPLQAYDQDRWVAGLRHNEDDPAELLAGFTALRTANLAFWQRLSEPERRRIGMHAERGPESVDMMFRMLAGHDRFHLDQMRRTIQSVRRGQPAGPSKAKP
jgi:DinB superfamily